MTADKLTTMSFPAFSGLFAILTAAAAAAPDDIPTCDIYNTNRIALKMLPPPNHTHGISKVQFKSCN